MSCSGCCIGVHAALWPDGGQFGFHVDLRVAAVLVFKMLKIFVDKNLKFGRGVLADSSPG
jgi:hypothetical protein